MKKYSIPIIVQETSGIKRNTEPVTFGLPFPKGQFNRETEILLKDPETGLGPLQTQPLAHWPDGTVKWLLLDSQVSVAPAETRALQLSIGKKSKKNDRPGISTKLEEDAIIIDTQIAVFKINRKIYQPFEAVSVNGNEISGQSDWAVVLTDEAGNQLHPVIIQSGIETGGKVRVTVKLQGEFKDSENRFFANFISRMHFYLHKALVKVEFTIHNPRAAKHPGGLWDLGDQGSIYFNDLTFFTKLWDEDKLQIEWQDNIHTARHTLLTNNLVIYQDSSGGENWDSPNHVNRNGEVKNSFRGYRVYEGGEVIKEGLRAEPVLFVRGKTKTISTAIQYFWQNFPKSLEFQDGKIIARFFPLHYKDVFELQGGEQKTHSIYFDFTGADLSWIQNPLIIRSRPQWYAQSKAIPYLIAEEDDPKKEIIDLINVAVKGNDSFFDRREIIDEYGWRNFGEFYADHEAVGYTGEEPFISHYNNQYDGIYGCLVQFLRSGNADWFVLADQLSSHVKDIDIYHTDEDRPEYNHGLFWHTEHYLPAETATHRCFSKKHLEKRNKANYGGGPSLSHLYTSGLLLHHYITGSPSSRIAVEDLATFAKSNIDAETSLSRQLKNRIKKTKAYLEQVIDGKPLVQFNKVYGLNGPGRASGNALNTLIDAYLLTNKQRYLTRAEQLIKQCIDPHDDIARRDLLDVENRWMYTIFLQALGKYLDIKTEQSQLDGMRLYAKQSLVHYAKWVANHETLYLTRPDKLQYPNETWAAQDMRKCNVLFYAAKYPDENQRGVFKKKANWFYEEPLNQLLGFETKTVTRPLAILLTNCIMYNYHKAHSGDAKDAMLDFSNFPHNY